MTDPYPLDRIDILRILKEVQQLLTLGHVQDAETKLHTLRMVLAEDNAMSERDWLAGEHGEHVIRQ